MKLATISRSAGEPTTLGAALDGDIVDLSAAYRELNGLAAPAGLGSVGALLAGGDDALDLALKTLVGARALGSQATVSVRSPIDSVVFHPPAPATAKVICVTVNYESHVTAGYTQPAADPYFFIKFPNILTGHRRPVCLSKTSQKCDSEIELVVVIGKRGKYIAPERAFDHIAGYTIGNDFSFRDRRTIKSDPESPRLHWLTLKNLDTAAPIGPWLVTRDEISDPYALEVSLTLENDPRVRVTGSSGGMSHDIPTLIAHASDGLTLEPGDLIFCGTPLPVAFGCGRFLKEGDVLHAEISGLGALINSTIRER